MLTGPSGFGQVANTNRLRVVLGLARRLRFKIR